jgi:integrase
MRVLETADDRIRPWLYLAAYAGLRACEVAQLRAEDVIRNAEPPMLLVTDGKGGKQRLIALHRSVVAAPNERAVRRAACRLPEGPLR